jgi:hypothetical protein
MLFIKVIFLIIGSLVIASKIMKQRTIIEQLLDKKKDQRVD